MEAGASLEPTRLPVGDRHILLPHLTPKRLLHRDLHRWAHVTTLEHKRSAYYIFYLSGEIDDARLQELAEESRQYISSSIDYARLPELSDELRQALPAEDKFGLPTVSLELSRDSILHDAAWKDMPDLVGALLKSGAPATMKGRNESPLHRAAAAGNVNIIQGRVKEDEETPG